MKHQQIRSRTGAGARAAGVTSAAAMVLLILALAPACATLGTPPEPVGTLVIENDNSMNVNIYATRNGTRIRMGTVTGVSSREFDIRQDMLSGAGELRLVIEPIGSPRSYPAMPITVRRGDVIELRVSTVLR